LSFHSVCLDVCRSRHCCCCSSSGVTDRHPDKQNGMTIRLTLCERDAISPPKIIREECVTLAQVPNYATESPLVTMGRPKFTLKTPLPFDDHHPHLIHPSLADLTHHLKWHPDPISHFATVHFLDRPTDTQTDRWDRRQVYSNSAYALLIVSDTLVIPNCLHLHGRSRQIRVCQCLSVFFIHCRRKRFQIIGTDFYGSNAFAVTQPTVSEREL